MKLDSILVTARNFADYEAMFAISDSDLGAGPILDCPAGVGGFGAGARERGARVVSVDPIYELGRDELLALGEQEIERNIAFVAANPDMFVWGPFASSPEDHIARRRIGLRAFAADYRPGSDDYVAALLPELPFADGAFALALSSHLLFSYGERLDHEFHLAALRELLRVTTGEVRAFPTVSVEGNPYARLDELRATLADDGVESELRRVAYEVQRGGHEMLVLRRS